MAQPDPMLVTRRKIGALCVDSTPEAIAAVLEQYGPVDRAVVETGRMTPSICLGLRDLGVSIVCIDARQAHQSLKAMKANKTDPARCGGARAAGTHRILQGGACQIADGPRRAVGYHRPRTSGRSARPA